ncbi:MAG: N-acetyltransferase [Rhodobacteraceae bacterium]|nr:MAG: N-acetyltransferase [Paracoccaceae bacterium]
MQDVLQTPRLTLRPLRADDAGPMSFWAARHEVAAMTSVPHPYPPGAAAAFIERATMGRLREQVWAIDGTPSGAAAFLGVVGLKGADADPVRTLGYWLGPPVWGAGYATEAAGAVVDAAFAETPAGAVGSRVYVDNLASRRVLEKLGFAAVGEIEEFNVARRAPVHALRFRLERAAWAARSPAAAE